MEVVLQKHENIIGAEDTVRELSFCYTTVGLGRRNK